MAQLKDDDDIPDTDHVLRYCSPRHVDKERIQPTAFQIREKEEYLSVYWLEYGGKSLKECLDHVRRAARINLELKKSGRLAKIHVGTAKEEVSGINIKYKPLPNGGESHAGIFPAQLSRMDLLKLSDCVSDVYPAVYN